MAWDAGGNRNFPNERDTATALLQFYPGQLARRTFVVVVVVVVPVSLAHTSPEIGLIVAT